MRGTQENTGIREKTGENGGIQEKTEEHWEIWIKQGKQEKTSENKKGCLQEKTEENSGILKNTGEVSGNWRKQIETRGGRKELGIS